MVQIIIAVMGIITVTIFNIGSIKIIKYGSLSSLITQPFWIYSTYTNQQYGMFLLSLYYTVMAGIGVYRGFFKSKEVKT